MGLMVFAPDQAKCLCIPGFNFVMPGKWRAACGRNFTAETCRLKDNTSKYYDMTTVENTVWEDSTYVVRKIVNKPVYRMIVTALFNDRECRKQRLPPRIGRRDLG